MSTKPTFLRVLGAPKCASLDKCPAILELEGGDYAVIGEDITVESEGRLPAGAGCGPGERLVRIPRSVVAAALEDLAGSRVGCR